MNASAVARHYGRLTPEERFRLIVAAGARGDKAEQERLLSAGQSIALRMPDHAPFVFAFHQLAVLVFVELLAIAADYSDAFHLADSADPFGEAEGTSEAEGAGDAEGGAARKTFGERMLDVALANGCMLKIKGDGWKLFCERMNVPPFAIWQLLPGFGRLQRALDQAERAAFAPEELVRWWNRSRPPGEPAKTAVPYTAETLAAGLERMFREEAAWWGGE